MSSFSAWLTIKGLGQQGKRPEYEYEIPLEDANELLGLCMGAVIEKKRYRLDVQGHVWEVDEFGGENKGLIIAEVELGSIDEPVAIPEWVQMEVTDDPRYLNSSLVTRPFLSW